MLIGLLGCVIPMLPGPPLAYAGLFLLHLTDKVHFHISQLLVWLLLVILLQILDFFTPMLGSKYGGGSKWGVGGVLSEQLSDCSSCLWESLSALFWEQLSVSC